jgi:hypothetical protein
MCTKLQNEMVSHYENNSQPAFEKAEATVQYMLKSKSDLGRAYAQVAMMRDALAFARDILLSETTDPGQHRASVNFLANYITQVTNNNVGAMAAIVLRKAAEYQTTKMQAEASDEGAFDTKTIKAIGELTEAIRAWMQAANEATQGGM